MPMKRQFWGPVGLALRMLVRYLENMRGDFDEHSELVARSRHGKSATNGLAL
jgi:hypothetical protein